MRELRPPVESTTADPAFETTAVGCGRVDEVEANQTASTSTGDVLLGSTLTSTDASSALLLHPHPQLQSFGTLVVLASAPSFVVALFALSNLLALWARYAPGGVDAATGWTTVAPGDDWVTRSTGRSGPGTAVCSVPIHKG